jgi:hypothetical protein
MSESTPSADHTPTPAEGFRDMRKHFPLILIGIMIFTYLYPRFLVSTLGEENPWTS